MPHVSAAWLRDARAALAVAVRTGVPALSVAAEKLLEQLEQAPPEPCGPQLVLWRPDGAPARFGRLSPEDVVQCPRLGCRALRAAECVQRAARRWPGGNRKKSGEVVQRTCRINPECSDCPEGELVRASMHHGWKPKQINFGPKDGKGQRQARRVWIRSRPEHQVPSIDAPPAAERCTDDERDLDAVAAMAGPSPER